MNSKQMPWPEFYELLKKLEKQHDFKLIMNEEDFGITKTTPLPKPFKKDQIVEAVVKCPGRYKNEVIAAAQNRSITITNFKDFDRFNNNSSGNYDKRLKIKITSDKHNLFYGKVV